MNVYFAYYKPFNVLSQFSDEGNKQGMGRFLTLEKDVYPIGRLDADSEGLLLLTNDRAVNHQLLDPKFAHDRTYLVQVEGDIDDRSISELCSPMDINLKKKTHRTLPARAVKLNVEPQLEERNPPVRFRKNIPTSWIQLTLNEGKNRQVRKMTAKVGYPTLRLVRHSIEGISLEGLGSGEIKAYDRATFYRLLKLNE